MQSVGNIRVKYSTTHGVFSIALFHPRRNLVQTGRSAPRQLDVGGPGGAKIPAVYGSGKSAPFHFNTRPPALLMNLGLLLACAKAAERFARQEPPLQTARWDVLAGPAGQTRAAAPEAAGFGLEPHGATTATAPGGRYREPLLAPRSDLCKHPQGGAAEISQRKRKRPQARGNRKRAGGRVKIIL